MSPGPGPSPVSEGADLDPRFTEPRGDGPREVDRARGGGVETERPRVDGGELAPRRDRLPAGGEYQEGTVRALILEQLLRVQAPQTLVGEVVPDRVQRGEGPRVPAATAPTPPPAAPTSPRAAIETACPAASSAVAFSAPGLPRGVRVPSGS